MLFFNRYRAGFVKSSKFLELQKGAVTIVDQAVVSATNFLTCLIMGRSLSKEQFGVYMLGFSIVLLLVNIQTSLILTPYTVFSPHMKELERTNYQASSFFYLICLTSLAAILLAIAGFVVSIGFGPSGLEQVMWVLSAICGFILLREYIRRILFAHLQMMNALWLDIGVAALQICGLFFLIYFDAATPGRAYGLVGFACAVPSLGWLLLQQNKLAVKKSLIHANLKRNWQFARWIFAGTLTAMVNSQLYPWVLASFHGTEATGELSACMGVLFLANPFLLGMASFLSPKTAHVFAADGIESLHRMIGKTMLFIAIVMGLFCLIVLLFGGWIVVLFYGEKYGGSAMIIRILALNQLAMALSVPVNCGLSAVERADIGLKSNLMVLPITLTLGLFFAKEYGAAGVAFGLLFGNLIACSYRYVTFKKIACIGLFPKHAKYSKTYN